MLQSISIHALLAESDALGAVTSLEVNKFLSTLSLRRATVGIKYRHTAIPISIHALLAESDNHITDLGSTLIPFLSTLSLRRATAFRSPRIALMVDFYPRSPCGERPKSDTPGPR